MMHRSELEQRLANDARQISAATPSRVRRAVRDELMRGSVRRGVGWVLPAIALAATGLLAATLFQPGTAPAPVAMPVADIAAGIDLDEALAARELQLADEYVRIQRDIERLRALIDPV